MPHIIPALALSLACYTQNPVLAYVPMSPHTANQEFLYSPGLLLLFHVLKNSAAIIYDYAHVDNI